MQNNKKAFTLIELLVVIAIIAILAAILFPVFASAREKARQTACLSNLKQLGLATIQYNQDYDECYYPHRFNINVIGANPFCTQSGGNYACTGSDGSGSPNTNISGNAEKRVFWISLIYPYVKSYGVFMCPDNANAWTGTNPNGQDCGGTTGATNSGCSGQGYGGENSYAHNDMWMSPACSNAAAACPASGVSVVNSSEVDRPSSQVLITDGTYYGGAPDLFLESGQQPVYNGQVDATEQANDQLFMNAQGPQYQGYWANIGNAVYSWSTSWGTGTPGAAANFAAGQTRHTGFVNVQFVDGHCKAIRYTKLISEMCYWVNDGPLTASNGTTTITNQPHPDCAGF